MAVLHRKEEKIQAVLGRLPKKYTNEEFIAMFIKLYSKDWGKIKSAYIKQSQDREPGTVINMPKPDLYLQQVLTTYLKNNAISKATEETTEAKVVEEVLIAKEKEDITEAKPKKVKTSTKGDEIVEELSTEPKKVKAAAKKKTTEENVIAKPKRATATKKAKEEKK